MSKVTSARLAGIIVAIGLISGCKTIFQQTPPSPPIITQEVVVPVAACPKEIDQMDPLVRPQLPIDQLTEADRENYDKVGKAYIQTTEDLKLYAEQLERQVKGIKGMCRSVNTAHPGTR